MTITIDSDGFAAGIGELTQEQYKAGVDTCWHPALNSTTAKLMVREKPLDAYLQHSISGRKVVREPTDAMDAGQLLDSLLTGPEYDPKDSAYGACRYVYQSGKNKGTESIVSYEDWNGLRIVDTETFQPNAAQKARDSSREAGLTPIKRSDFDAGLEALAEIRISMERAGVDLECGKFQVPVFWAETASDGTRVQCRALLDWYGEDRNDCPLIRDIKRVASLRDSRLMYAVEDYCHHLQAAAYKRAVWTLFETPTTFEWIFVREKPSIAVRRIPIGSTMLQVGNHLWQRAIDAWARALNTGVWDSWEEDSRPLEASQRALLEMESDQMMEEDNRVG